MSSKNEPRTVLVTDGCQRKALPIVRSLGRRGLSVLVGDCVCHGPAFYSRYCATRHVYPDPSSTPELFIEWLIAHAQKGLFDVLFPIDEITMTPVTQHRSTLEEYMVVPVVDHETYMRARDKGQTLRIAEKCGIPCPKTMYPDGPEDVRDLADCFPGAIVVKPRVSSGSRGIGYVTDRTTLDQVYRRVHSIYPQPLLQEFIPPGGDTYGVEVLMDKTSEPKAVFAHRRLREYPISGGPSTLRESVVRPEMVEMGVQMARALGWYGVAMVEFKVDPRTSQPLLMEVNPKFWGSIALSIVAGVDFPYLLYQLAVSGDVPAVHQYAEGVRCRWLTGDILHFLKNPRRFQLEPSFFQFRGTNLYYDIIDKTDMGPLWGFLVGLPFQLVSRGVWRDLLFRG